MRQVTIARISDYRRSSKPSYKVVVQPIAPASLLQRMAGVATAFAAPNPKPVPVYATVTPIDRFRICGSR